MNLSTVEVSGITGNVPKRFETVLAVSHKVQFHEAFKSCFNHNLYRIFTSETSRMGN